ncbi:MAG: BrxE family protein [Deltaproteobacteria bacterium]|nr:BrxE family protein [Deltaproteobacteria bacterium]
MTQKDLKEIAKLRVCIGFLGESHQYSWWQSSFFSVSSLAFLSPVFGKTSFLAKYYGVKEAATLVHDKHIGVGKGVFHLFRLPEILEIELHGLFEYQEIVKDLQQIIGNKDSAEQFLRKDAIACDISELGPIRLGDHTDVVKKSVWQTVAQHYLKAFQEGTRIFPYFSEVK